MKLSKVIKKTGVGLIFAASVFGCGSAANDQGSSFTLAGFGAVTIDPTTGDTTCSTTVLTNTVTTPLGLNEDGTASETIACLLMQNHLTSSSIRTERAEISYYIPGADEQPPPTSAPAFVYLGPVGTSDASTSSSSSSSSSSSATPTDHPGIAELISLPVNIVPAEITSWISLNRNKLPEPPFSMDIIVHVLGITTSGDELQTNDGFLQAQVINDFIINDNGIGGSSSETPTATP